MSNTPKPIIFLLNRCFVHVLLPIIIGTSIYALWRGVFIIDPDRLIFPIFKDNKPANFILYNLPDALWLFALLNAIILIHRRKFSCECITWLFVALTLTITAELLQKMDSISGTFDKYDIIAYLIAFIASTFKEKRFLSLFPFIN